jgi:hypothetical protein
MSRVGVAVVGSRRGRVLGAPRVRRPPLVHGRVDDHASTGEIPRDHPPGGWPSRDTIPSCRPGSAGTTTSSSSPVEAIAVGTAVSGRRTRKSGELTRWYGSMVTMIPRMENPARRGRPPGIRTAEGELTNRQAAIVRCITEAVLRKGYPPSMRGIGRAVELASTSRSPARGRRAEWLGDLLPRHHANRRPQVSAWCGPAARVRRTWGRCRCAG